MNRSTRKFALRGLLAAHFAPVRLEDLVITRHDFREGRARYEQISESHHDHLINLRSGQVIEFQSEEIERLQREVARKLGYKLVDHRLELYAVPLDDDKKR